MSRPRVCRNCPKRTMTCHSTCEAYAGEVAERANEKEAARKEQILPLKRLNSVRKYQNKHKYY